MFKIFPVELGEDGRKKPIFSEWAEQSSADPEVHRKWNEFYGKRIVGYGLPTGKINGVWALDIDVKDGLSGFDSIRSFGINELPATAYQVTPSGGMHLFFKADQQHIHYPTSVNRETKIDSRGEGGFVWLYEPNFNIPMIEAPQWVWSSIKKQNKKDKIEITDQSQIVRLEPSLAIDTFNNSIEAIRNAAQGERNHTLNTHAYVVGKLVAAGALGSEYAYEKLKEAAHFNGLDPREAHATIMSGLGSGVQNPMTHPFANTPIEPSIRIPELTVIEPRPRWTPKFGTLAMLTDWTKLKKPQLFEDWSTEDIHLTSAVGGVGKTTLKVFEAVCLALGEDFLRFKNITPGRTLFIIGEDSEEKLYAILGKMCKDMGLLKPENEHKLQAVINNVIFKRSSDICLVMQDPRTRTFIPNEEALTRVKEAIDDLKPKQIVWDPIAMFWGSEAGGNDMAMALSKAMHHTQSYSNASVDIITHIGKDSHTRKDLSQFSSRGGTALANHARVVRTLLKLNADEYREETGLELGDGQTAILCNVSKFSDGSPILDKPFVILRTGYLFERVDCIEKSETQKSNDVSKEKDEIYKWLKANSTEERPVTQKDLADIMVLSGIKKTVSKSVVTMLKLEKLVEEIPHIDGLIGSWLRVI